MFTTKYDDVLRVSGNEIEQINYKFHYFTPYSHPLLFDVIARYRGWCIETIAVKHSERNKHIKVCNICDEVRTPVLSTCPLHTNSGCGKERRILIDPW